ncbi:hypothetical protein CW713_03445 [Methanophagales archaeon]|nr:MAG: hypothetical protein CW713_03445 [Methanophagales archaeon]
MSQIALHPKEDKILEETGKHGEIYIYPSHQEKGFMAGFGIISDSVLKFILAGLDRDMLKFYDEKNKHIPFIFLGSTFYRKELEKVFGLKPFIIRDEAIVYYTSGIHQPEIENYHVDVKNGTHEYFDENIGGLNPLVHLIDLSQSGWRKNAYKDVLKSAIREGFLTNWNNINKLNFNEIEQIRSGLEETSMLNISNGRMLQKWLNRAINDLVKSDIELFRDLRSITISADTESSLKVFKNLYGAITEEVTKERIIYKEFPAKMIVKDIEIQFKMSLPKDKVNLVFNFLKKRFKSAKIVYSPDAVNQVRNGRLRKSKLYRFSIIIEFNKEYHEMQMITWIDAVIDALVKGVREINVAWHISKKYIWVKRLWIEVTAPTHFKEKVFEALTKTGWMVVSWDETKFKEGVWKLRIEIWCNYPIYESKSRKEIDLIMKSEFQEFEELDEKLYRLTFPTKFIMDCSRFFVSFYERLSREDVLIL